MHVRKLKFVMVHWIEIDIAKNFIYLIYFQI